MSSVKPDKTQNPAGFAVRECFVSSLAKFCTYETRMTDQKTNTNEYYRVQSCMVPSDL